MFKTDDNIFLFSNRQNQSFTINFWCQHKNHKSKLTAHCGVLVSPPLLSHFTASQVKWIRLIYFYSALLFICFFFTKIYVFFYWNMLTHLSGRLPNSLFSQLYKNSYIKYTAGFNKIKYVQCGESFGMICIINMLYIYT